METKEKISLIIATLGRRDELASLLQSLCRQTINTQELQVIIVDQNPEGYLEEIVSHYGRSLNIKYIHSSRRGLSLNRNIGLELAEGEIIGFPDDDCTYTPNTLKEALRALSGNDVDLIIGRLVDPKSLKDAIKRWPQRRIRLNSFNFYKCSSSATMFVKTSTIRFDENFGVGAKWGSNEDAIFIYRHITSQLNCIYDPSIIVQHPDQKYESLDTHKIRTYGIGFGKFIRSYISLSLLILFVGSISYQLCLAFYGATSLRFDISRKRLLAFSSRINGFINEDGNE